VQVANKTQPLTPANETIINYFAVRRQTEQAQAGGGALKMFYYIYCFFMFHSVK